MVDVETNSGGGTAPNNPYTGGPPVLPHWHPLNVLRRLMYMGASLWGLDYFEAYRTLMRDPSVSHEWFKVGLAATIAILSVKAYVELYAGKLQKQKVDYQNFKQSTHVVMILILLASFAFNASLWPAYGAKSLLVMTLVGTFVLNFCLLFPTYVQNITAFALLTFFVQEYK